MRQGLGLALMPLFAVLSRPTPVLFMAGAFIVVLGCLVRVYASGYIVKNKQLATDGDTQMMRNVSAMLTDDEIKAVASYIQGLR